MEGFTRPAFGQAVAGRPFSRRTAGERYFFADADLGARVGRPVWRGESRFGGDLRRFIVRIPLKGCKRRPSSRPLLQNMGQLMGDQLLSIITVGVVGFPLEKEIASCRKSDSLNGSIQLVGPRVRVNPHLPEIG